MRENVTIICTDVRDAKRLDRFVCSVIEKYAKGYVIQSNTPIETSGVSTLMKRVPKEGRLKKHAD